MFEPRTDTESVLFSYFTCLHTTTLIFLSLFALVETISDFENLGETNILTCKMFTSGCRPWLKNVACVSSLIFLSDGRQPEVTYFPIFLFNKFKSLKKTVVLRQWECEAYKVERFGELTFRALALRQNK